MTDLKKPFINGGGGGWDFVTQAHKLHYIDMSWGEGGQISSNFYDAIFERSLRCYPSNVNVLSFERCIKH